MTTSVPDLQDFRSQFEALAREVYAQGEIIAFELDRRPHMDVMRIKVAETAISWQIHLFYPLHQRFVAAGHAAAKAAGHVPTAQLLPDWMMLQHEVARLRFALNKWNRIQVLIGRQSPPQRRSLVGRPANAGEAHVTALRANDALVERLQRVLNPREQTEEAEANGCYDDVPLPQSAFASLMTASARLLKAQGKHDGIRFIDVGCGGGLKVVSALEFFGEATGLEVDPAYAKSARKLVKAVDDPRARIVEGDALEFGAFDQFDIVFLFRPIRDPERMRALEQKITRTVQPGTLLVAPYEDFLHQSAELGCAPVIDQVFLAGGSKRSAASLRRRAEWIGPNVTSSTPPLVDLWHPIEMASHRLGF